MAIKTDTQLKTDNNTVVSKIDNRYNHLTTLKTLIDDVVDSKERPLGNPSANGQVLSSTTDGARSWITPSTGGGTPAGATGQIQFNNAGAFGANANLHWDNTTSRLGLGIAVPLAQLHVKSLSASVVPSIYQAAASQNTDLTQWQSSTGVVFASINGAGSFGCAGTITSNNLIGNGTIRAVEVNSNGTLIATSKRNRTLAVFTNTVIFTNPSTTPNNIYSVIVNISTLSKDGDKTTFETIGQNSIITGGGAFTLRYLFRGFGPASWVVAADSKWKFKCVVTRLTNTTATIYIEGMATNASGVTTNYCDFGTYSTLAFETGASLFAIETGVPNATLTAYSATLTYESAP